MEKRELSYLSADGKTNIHAIKWIPSGQPRGVLQIVHGMSEYIDRYNDFAEFLTEHGYVVVGEDHLGHGASLQTPQHLGYFGDHGNEWVIADIHQLRTMTQSEYPELSYSILGHSMGSFLTRQYITEQDGEYARGLAKVIIMGTGWQPAVALAAGKAIAKMSGTKKLGTHSPLLNMMAFGSYLKRIPHFETVHDWLTKDKEIVKQYRDDPLCGFHFTPNAYYHMFAGMEKAHDVKRMKKLPAGLPILFVSGAEDPVGNWGEAVRKAYMVYSENTECKVDIQLYLDDRHEILNETDREQVYKDLLDYLDAK